MSLAVLADHMASKGRGPDSMLIHMSPREVQGLQALAMAHGGSLTVNPETGLPEAGFLDKLLPTILGAGLTFMGVPPNVSAMIVGGIQTVRTGDLGKGIQAGLGAYGGANLTSNMMTAGSSALGADANMLAAQQATELSGLESMSSAFGGAGATADAVGQAATSATEVATPFEKLSRGFDTTVDQFKNNPMQALKTNAKDLAYAFGPAILAEANVKNNMPQTVTKPGMITPYASFGGQYVAGAPYQATPTRAAGGGLMGMDDGGYGPGQLDFAQKSEPVVRMAEGGIVALAAGGETPAYFLANPDVAKAFNENAGGYATGLNAQQYADLHYKTHGANEIAAGTRALSPSVDLASSAAGITPTSAMAALVANPNMRPEEFDVAASQYNLNNYNATSPLIHGYQVANDKTAAAQQYLKANPDVQAYINSQAGKDYLAANPQFDASDIAFTHFQRYGEKEGRKWEEAAKKPLTCPAGYRPNAAGTACEPIPIVSTCPAPDMRILLANGSLKAAGDLQIGDVIRTQHETTLAWGDHPVTHVSIVPNVPRLKIEFGDVKFVCSLDHKFFKAAGKWVSAKDVVLGDMLSGHTVRSLTQADVGDVVRITVDDAHTYICEGLLSHNKSPQAPVVNPPTAINATQNTSTNVTTPTDIATAASTALPVGISGAGITTINPNGTVTTRPDIPGIPEGGFTGMTSLRDAYEAGGGSLGVNKYLFAPKTSKEIEDRYKLTGGSKQAMDYLTGKTKYTPIPYTEDGQISKSYAESVMKLPKASSDKMYIFSGGKFIPNPDYAISTRDKEGVLSRNVTNQNVIDYVKSPEYSNDDAFLAWMTTNNLSPEQIATATGMSIADVYKKIKKAKPATTTTGATTPADLTDQSKPPTTDPGSGNEWLWDYASKKWYVSSIQVAGGGDAAGGLMKLARGGMSQQFDLGGYSDGGRLLRGPGDGVSDSIPATIGNKRPARLADGEFVVPARIVSELGNGSTEAGARKLYAMMDRVQAARRGTVGKGRVAKNSRSDKYLPA